MPGLKQAGWSFMTGPLLMLLAAGTPGPANAHGFAGKRFFPATLTFDDPYPADEFDMIYGHVNDVNLDDGPADTDTLSVEYAKTIIPGVAFSVGTAFDRFSYKDGSSNHGFDNIGISGKFMGHVNDQGESIWSYGVDVGLGGTSSHGIGEDFSVFSPTFFFGKGLGNLPDSHKYLRPFAVTGALAMELPTRGNQPRALNTSFSLQYNISYLESFVKDVGLPGFLRNSLLIVELPVDTCLDHGCRGDVTGTVNPGVMFFNSVGQISLEAPIPVNDRTGNSVGVLVQLHLYLDDIFPHSLGKPIFD